MEQVLALAGTAAGLTWLLWRIVAAAGKRRSVFPSPEALPAPGPDPGAECCWPGLDKSAAEELCDWLEAHGATDLRLTGSGNHFTVRWRGQVLPPIPAIRSFRVPGTR